MKLKRIIAAFLAVATIFSVTACSGSETSSVTIDGSSVTSEVSKDESSKEEESKEESKTETSAPETSEPETSAPETSEPETSAPETSEPETSAPETSEPETSAPETTTTTTTEAPETEKPNESTPSEKSEMTDKLNTFKLSEDNAKHLGRTYTDGDGTVWLSHSASALEFTFTGTKASVTVCEDIAYGAGSEPRFAIYVNDERVEDVLLKEKEKTIDFYSADSAKETKVKIIKLSEAANSIFGVKSVSANTTNLVPTAKNDLKIEFIGDSITCGYGVDDEVKENHFSTATEDATRAYAYKTAMNLGADYSLVSFSGHGIISGYSGDGKKQDQQLVPTFYGKVARNYSGSKIVENDWDFSRFTPDVIVINLGTNDNSYVKKDKAKEEEYKAGYIAFLKQIREKNPDAFILCTLGTMGNELFYPMKHAVDEYKTETGDTNVDSLALPTQSAADGYAADWHPTEKSHVKAADRVTLKIKYVLGIE